MAAMNAIIGGPKDVLELVRTGVPSDRIAAQ